MMIEPVEIIFESMDCMHYAVTKLKVEQNVVEPF